jgi:hypothetical protein
VVAALCAPTVSSVHLVGIGGAVFLLVALFTAFIAARAAKAMDDQADR